MFIPKPALLSLVKHRTLASRSTKFALTKRATTNGEDGNIVAPSTSLTSPSSSTSSTFSSQSPSTPSSSATPSTSSTTATTFIPFPPSNITPTQTPDPDSSQDATSGSHLNMANILVPMLVILLVLVAAAGAMCYFNRNPEKWRRNDGGLGTSTAAEHSVTAAEGDEERRRRRRDEKRGDLEMGSTTRAASLDSQGTCVATGDGISPPIDDEERRRRNSTALAVQHLH